MSWSLDFNVLSDRMRTVIIIIVIIIIIMDISMAHDP